jgi:hypothetical protein
VPLCGSRIGKLETAQNVQNARTGAGRPPGCLIVLSDKIPNIQNPAKNLTSLACFDLVTDHAKPCCTDGISLANNLNGESFKNSDVPMLPMVAYGAYPHVAVGIGTSLGECPILAIGIGRNRQTYSIVGEFMGVMGDQAMSAYEFAYAGARRLHPIGTELTTPCK